MSWGDFSAAAKQAETNAPPDKIPIAIVKKKRVRDADALVLMRLETFLDALTTKGDPIDELHDD